MPILIVHQNVFFSLFIHQDLNLQLSTDGNIDKNNSVIIFVLIFMRKIAVNLCYRNTKCIFFHKYTR